MLSNQFGHFLDRPLSPLARKVTVHPHIITIAGFLITALAAAVVTQNLFLGGILILLGGLFDLFDGIVARVNNKTTNFGAFLDSVMDRYSDSFLLIGFAWYFFLNGSAQGMLLSLGTLAGTLIISYAKARAEGLGKQCRSGLMERPERIILMVFGTLTGWVLPVMWILLVLTHLTVLQRIYHVWTVLE